MKALLAACVVFLAMARAAAAPGYVATFHSIGLYWSPPGGGADTAARVEFRPAAGGAWREGLPLWFDARNGEYRGSLVELHPGTPYLVRLTLASGYTEMLRAATWREALRIRRTVLVPRGTTELVIEPADSGSERDGYVLFTAAPGANVIDQSALEGDAPQASCVVVRQGAHHVIVRGLVLKGCRRHGVLLERRAKAPADAATHDIVIEDNDISGWGGHGNFLPDAPDEDGAIHCNYGGEADASRKPTRIVVQRNRIHDPRHGANPWQASGPARAHPRGPQAVNFRRCGTNHVFRYNDIFSANGNRYNDAIGGSDNFSTEGFPWADSDLYGNRISDAYDDGIEAEGANRNVRIWGNYFDRVFVAIGNAATAVGPLYVWRNVSHRMAGMENPAIHPDLELRGPFIKAGSHIPLANGGRAYYFHNTALQPPAGAGGRLALGAGGGIVKSGGALYNFVSRNNIWHVHDDAPLRGRSKAYSIRADCDAGPCDADFDLHNGRVVLGGASGEAQGWGPGARGRPVYASSGSSYPDAKRAGDYALAPGSPGYRAAERIPNFNDAYARPDVGAHQSGTPPMRFGRAAALQAPDADALAAKGRRVAH